MRRDIRDVTADDDGRASRHRLKRCRHALAKIARFLLDTRYVGLPAAGLRRHRQNGAPASVAAQPPDQRIGRQALEPERRHVADPSRQPPLDAAQPGRAGEDNQLVVHR